MNNTRIIFLSLFLSTACFESLFSQLTQPNRFEITLGDNESPYSVIKGDDNRLLLFRKIVNTSEQNGQLWEVLQLDTTFQEVWKQAYVIDSKFLFAKHKRTQ